MRRGSPYLHPARVGSVSVDTAVLYAHVADDGGVLTIDGESGRSTWVPLPELVRRLELLQKTGGSLLLSREQGSPVAAPVFEAIRRAGVPTTLSRQIHSDAIRTGGSTALMSAAYVGAEELARDLVDRGAGLEAQDEEGFTALMYAANAGQDRLARLLIEAGAEVNQVDRAGSTPLMFAAQHGHTGLIKKLLAAGATVGARRADGLTARDFAARNGHDRAAAILQSVELQLP